MVLGLFPGPVVATSGPMRLWDGGGLAGWNWFCGKGGIVSFICSKDLNNFARSVTKTLESKWVSFRIIQYAQITSPRANLAPTECSVLDFCGHFSAL